MNKKIEIGRLIRFAVNNNKVSIINSLFNNQVLVDKQDDKNLKRDLFNLYLLNKAKFFNVMKGFVYNKDANNWTTSEVIKNKLGVKTDSATMRTQGEDPNARASWTEALDILLGKEQSDSTTTTEKPSMGSTWVIVLTALGAIGIIGAIIYFVNKS